MKRKKIYTDKAPEPVAPYSQAIKIYEFESLIFVSGQAGIDPETGEMVKGGIKPQTRQTLENLKTIIEESGATLDDVVKVNVYMTDINDFEKINEVYGDYFGESKPARAAVEVSDIASDFEVEIEAIVAL